MRGGRSVDVDVRSAARVSAPSRRGRFGRDLDFGRTKDGSRVDDNGEVPVETERRRAKKVSEGRRDEEEEGGRKERTIRLTLR